uniref:Cellular tumor antigen p53 n=1 Tax=Anthurium amnicola TaxID=1678845 RepID=A0A1D1ZEK7_9ARAE
MRFLWMSRLMEKIHEAATTSSMATVTTSTAPSDHSSALPAIAAEPPMQQHTTTHMVRLTPDNSTMAESLSDSSAGTSELSSSSPVSELTGSHDLARWGSISDCVVELPTGGFSESDPLSSCGYLNQVGFPEFEQTGWGAAGGFSSQNSWFADDIWF